MNIRSIPTLFGLPEASELTELNAGHINRTFLAVCGGEKYILQSLNRSVFCRPESVMDNIRRIEETFAGAGGSFTAVPHFIACGDKNYAAADGELWRMYRYITAAAGAAADAAAAGRAFGAFIKTMDGRSLCSVSGIEGYHDIDGYFGRLAAKGSIDRENAAVLEKVRAELGEVFDKDMPERIIHGDAKTDNVITGEHTVLIDLDTVMYGYAALDYGDLIRSVSAEEFPDTERIREATLGFAEGLDGLLTDAEVGSLYYGILRSIAELAVRYFADSLSDEKYFRGKSSADCLVRAGQLMRQLSSFIERENELKKLIYRCFDRG
ncbi:MAG: aminoglycoside phosphotransferase family protein [Ruminococcus sp.]|nr:aminoglycoside phosphotransferase family protein [Ruminococcus sp.]